MGAEFGTLRRQGDQPGVPGECNTPPIRRRRASRLGLLATFIALAGALAAPAAAVPRPDPAPTAKRATEQPAPDPFQSSAGSGDATSSSLTPDQPPPTTSPVSPPAAEPRPTTPAPVAAAPPVAEKPTRRTTTQRKDVQVVWVPPSRVRNLGPQETASAAVIAVVAPAERRGLVLGGLALLTLAAASGSLLFLVARGGVREARS